jgi:hypothetical protein
LSLENKEHGNSFKESKDICEQFMENLYPGDADNALFEQTYEYYELYLSLAYTDYTCLLLYLLLGSYAVYQMGTLSMEIQDIAHGSSFADQNVFWRMLNYFSIRTKRIIVIIISGSLGAASISLYIVLMKQRKQDFSIGGIGSGI